MHIPDGYLGPASCAATWGVMLPVWWVSARRVGRTLAERQVPVLAAAAGFSFVVMMLNVPLPGGTTGHATGGALAGILLGPGAGMLAVSVALALQALIFADGGITTLAANCLNMAVLSPLAGYWIHRLLARRLAAPWAAGLAGYGALNLAALGTALLLGAQPFLAHDAAGRPLYAPYGFGIAVPAIMIGHLLVFGPVEGLVTGGAMAFLARVAKQEQSGGARDASGG